MRRVHACEVGPGGGVVLLHKGAGVYEEELHIAVCQVRLESPLTIPAPVPLCQIGVHLRQQHVL